MPNAIGIIEVSSIALGYQVQDELLKAADVDLIMARTICSGKYIVMIGGGVGAVNASVAHAAQIAQEGIIEQIVIPNVHPQVFPALSGSAELGADDLGALGVIEAFSATTAIQAADAAVKAANVTVYRVHIAMAIGGKGFVLLTGDVAAVTAAVAAGAQLAAEHGLLVNKVVIPRPRRELFRDFI